MLKSIGFGDFVRIFLQFEMTWQGLPCLICVRFGWDAVQDSTFKTISKSSLGLRSYSFLSYHWFSSLSLLVLGSICEFSLYHMTCFLLSVSSQFLDLDLVISSLRAWFQVYLSQPWLVCVQAKAVQYDLLGVGSHFEILCFFRVVLANGINKCGWSLAVGRGS